MQKKEKDNYMIFTKNNWMKKRNLTFKSNKKESEFEKTMKK